MGDLRGPLQIPRQAKERRPKTRLKVHKLIFAPQTEVHDLLEEAVAFQLYFSVSSLVDLFFRIPRFSWGGEGQIIP